MGCSGTGRVTKSVKWYNFTQFCAAAWLRLGLAAFKGRRMLFSLIDFRPTGLVVYSSQRREAILDFLSEIKKKTLNVSQICDGKELFPHLAGKVLSVISTFNSSFFFNWWLTCDMKQLFLLSESDNIVNNVKKNTDSPTQTSASNVLNFPKKTLKLNMTTLNIH